MAQNVQSSQTLYRRTLGEAFDALPPILRRFHDLPEGGRAQGVLHITRGKGFLRHLVASAMRLPAPGERVMHALMGILYGLFLAYLLPNILQWMQQPTGFGSVRYGALSWVLTLMAGGVLSSGIRDFVSAQRGAEFPKLLGERNAAS